MYAMEFIKQTFAEIRHFKPQEFASPDRPDSWTLINPKLVIIVDALREIVDRPFHINSAFRTATHNARVGGEPRSQHMFGRAVDISTSGWGHDDRMKLVIYARKLGIKGIGIYPSFIHLDVRVGPSAAWKKYTSEYEKVPVGQEASYV